jgi:hypothetical protein
VEKIAIDLKQTKSRGHARLYRVTPPLADFDGNLHDYVVVSAVEVPYEGPETYIFPAAAGADEPTAWLEMPGSERGTLSHERVLHALGYRIVRAEAPPVKAPAGE